MKKAMFAALTAAVLLAGAVPFLSGCKADINYTLSGEGENKYYIASCTGVASALSGELVIQDYIDGIPVKEIAAEGFVNTAVTKLVIPSTVEKLGNLAFAYCTGLSEIQFAEGSCITEISQGAFAFCTALKNIELPEGVEKIGPMAFTGDDRLKSAELPQTLTEISYRAFYNCTRLESVNLPPQLQTVGDLAFYYAGLMEITVPQSVKTIGKGAFHSCTSLKTARVEADVTAIDCGVFGYCTALESVYLPQTLQKIEGAFFMDDSFIMGHAFHNCASLKDVYFAGSEEQWNAVQIIVGKSHDDNSPVTVNGATYDNTAVKNAVKHYGI